MKIVVTGGAGFIGSAVVRRLIETTDHAVVTVDALTYAASLDALAAVADSPRHCFERADIRESLAMRRVFDDHRPDAVMHLAAETHVDRSIDGPGEFISTNITGTFVLLEAARAYWSTLDERSRQRFRFHHVSTDEVYGSLGETGSFREDDAYRPSSPYAASKAAADHLARAWGRTYGLPVIVTNSVNNFGPWQFPEKLIPLIVRRASAGLELPVYGSGANVRDWLYVEDHADGLIMALGDGEAGDTYNIGGADERANIDVVRTICALLDEMRPDSPHRPHEKLIRFVSDRPGHDLRYALDAGRIRDRLGWRPLHGFEDALRTTIAWYLENGDWCERIMGAADYGGERLGRAAAPPGGTP